MKFVIVTGISGAGKTTALKALENMGFFCVDNLPSILLTKFAGMFFFLAMLRIFAFREILNFQK